LHRTEITVHRQTESEIVHGDNVSALSEYILKPESTQYCILQAHCNLQQRFSNWSLRTKGGPRRVPRGSARGFRKV